MQVIVHIHGIHYLWSRLNYQTGTLRQVRDDVA